MSVLAVEPVLNLALTKQDIPTLKAMLINVPSAYIGLEMANNLPVWKFVLHTVCTLAISMIQTVISQKY